MTAFGSIDVNVAVKIDHSDLDLASIFDDLQSALNMRGGPILDIESLMKTARTSLKQSVEKALGASFAQEFNEIVGAYRDMLERRMASGQDEAISRALTRATLQTEVLSSASMVDQSQACDLLGLSGTNPSASLKRYEAKDKILRFDLRGKAVYPFFQFDVAERRIEPTLLTLLGMRTDDWGGRMALLHWLTRPNLSLGGSKPCDVLAAQTDGVVQSFAAEIAEPLNG